MPSPLRFPHRRRHRAAAGLVGLALLLPACTAPAPVGTARDSTLSIAADTAFLTLGPSDVVAVEVLGHPELSTDPEVGARVDPQGVLHLPLVGGVEVTGLTLDQLNETLHLAYDEYMREPSVTARVLDYGSRTYHVLGNMADPGVKTLDRPLSALEALARGGRFLPGADRASCFLLRPRGDLLEVHRFDARTPDAAGLVQVRPGDIVFVRQKGTQDLQEDLVPILSAFGLNALLVTSLDD